MSLAEAVKDIADDMESHATQSYGADVSGKSWDALCSQIEGWVKQLRTAVKASGNQQQLIIPTGPDTRWMEKRANLELQQREEMKKQEEEGFKTVECVGGNSDGTFIPDIPAMPEGAKTKIGGEVYEYRAGKFHFVG